MGEIAAISFAPSNFTTGKRRNEKFFKHQEWQSYGVADSKSRRKLINNQMAIKPATYSSTLSTDVPLYEIPGASFDRYLENKPRVFKAMFPDKRRNQRLNEEEWRIQMLPINFLFLTVFPLVDVRLRCKSGGRDYPPQVPKRIAKLLELDITRWELEGLNNVLEPSHFSLGIKGLLYADRLEQRTRLKGQLEMSISLVLPPVLALIPENVRRNVAETVLTRLVQDMKRKVNSNLLADYSEFKGLQPKNMV